MNEIIYLQRCHQHLHPAAAFEVLPRNRSRLFGLIRQKLSDFAARARRVRAEAELRQKLEGYDDHLLRDMGMVRSGERIESLYDSAMWWRGREG